MYGPNSHKPLLGIALPVYNGERFIAETIASILSQTFEDYVLVISDNASSDGTQEICRRFAEQDQRIRYFRNDNNIGMIRNTVQAYDLSQPSKYFALIGHDDGWAPTYAQKLVCELEAHPESPLAFSWLKYIDASGRQLSNLDRGSVNAHFPRMAAMSKAARLSFQPSACFIHGILRADIWQHELFTQRYGIYEDVFMLRVFAAHGPFQVVPEVLFHKRMHKANFSSSREHSRQHSQLNCLQAVRTMRRFVELTGYEMFRVWMSLVWFFYVRNSMVRVQRKLARLRHAPSLDTTTHAP